MSERSVAKYGKPTNASLKSMLPEVYNDLNRLGRSLLKSETNEVILEPAAVVSEAYIRLADVNVKIQDRKHCFRLLAQTMRRVVIDSARARRAARRELPSPDELETLIGSEYGTDHKSMKIDLARALEQLDQKDPQAAQILQLAAGADVTIPELAAIFGVSEPTIERNIRMGRESVQSYFELAA